MVIAEGLRNQAELDASSPTTLHLFRPNQNERPGLLSKAHSVEQFTNNIRGTFEFLDKLRTAGERQIDRLSQAEKELDQQIRNLNSSATCSAVYLKMQEDLPYLSPPELMEFFRLCLRTNIKVLQFVGGVVTAKDSESSLKKALIVVNNRKNLALQLKIIDDEMAGDPPAWFKDGKKSWGQFLRVHSSFSVYLSPGFIPNLDSEYNQKTLKKIRDDDLGYVVSGEYPDWLDDNHQTIPTKGAVQQELSEDLSEVKKVLHEKERISHQEKYIEDNFTHKSKKAQEWYGTQVRRLFARRNVSFLDQILILYLLSNNKKPIEEIIQEFSNDKNLVSNPEPIALFIEKTMKKSGIIKSTNTPIDGHFVDLFNMLFESIEERSREFADLKEKNKKVFGSLNYDIKPLLEIMTPDEISFLRELLEEYKGYPIEPFIWTIAESASSHFKKEESEPKEKLKMKTTESLRRPMASFLRKNWKWAYDQFKQSLSSPDLHFVPLSPAETFDQNETAASLNVPEIQRELTSSIKEIQEGNLSGWQLLYSKNKTTDQKYLVEIGGETIEQRTTTLEELCRQEGIPYSIKSVSIIDAFDWLVTVPKEVEQVRIRQTVNGEEFKKLKRGRMRIFYIMDETKKQIIFFLHQKQAWNYGF